MLNKRKSFFNLILPIIVFIGSACTVFFVFFSLKGKKIIEERKQNIIPIIEKDTDNTNTPDYTVETNYTGKLARYPELYQIPFKKTSEYICNKDYSKTHKKLFEICEMEATSFVENLFNVNYRDIASDRDSFYVNVMQSAEYDGFITKDFDTDNPQTMLFKEYINEWIDYFIENQVQMEAEFYTDDSLVYSDYYTFVRGEIVFTIYDNKDTSCKYEVGKEYSFPLEVALAPSYDDYTFYVIRSFGRADDPYFFY